jgi:hypothetical protein
VIWVLVCATAGAAPHSSATAMSAIAIRLSMATGGEGSRASTPRWSAQNWVPKSQRPFFTFVFSRLGPGGTVISAWATVRVLSELGNYERLVYITKCP